ncbi:glutamine synthetase family protein [Parvibaculum sp.]|jgi:glutamine synthetase|uniref:glutamine synthetase family protein n=1 Tax=Parvibaculum sp. TaxID=2024848 RepID=UPI001AFE1ABB|nr:glutamine synthetase family protein [Parvibaculum sp.]MBO6633997.1 glutamine synthetase [Parvibaculum sp.]MBO6680053.1 glutamine synthetase [Parvibaculum sp.]MBO6683618.1 glutamine synthetase [Parvibaculum sp.]
MTRATEREAADFLAAHPETVQIQAFLTDPSGVARGKVLRPEELSAAYRDGRPLPCSIQSLDMLGADVLETGLVWEEGDSDRPCFPIAGTLTHAPWHDVPTAQVVLASWEPDGSPTPADPRHALARTVAGLKAMGLTPVVAIELEFYLVDREAAAKRRIAPPAAPNGFVPAHLQAYLMQDLEDFSPFLNDVFEGAKKMGLPARTLISEYAPGQFEIVLEHRADAMRAADDAILYKRLVKGMADRHGFVATFMAKPYADVSGSGMHMHVSLAGEGSANLFAGDGTDLTPHLAHAIGGLERTMAESMAMFAPNANSFRRFRRNTYAPTTPAWAVDNRSVPLRVTAGKPETRHLEHRVCGADANPYVALATVLAGIAEGIEKKIAPSAPVTGDGYRKEREETLPLNWWKALDVARGSSFLPSRLGKGFTDTFLTIKEVECDRFFASVSDVDAEWYLRNA